MNTNHEEVDCTNTVNPKTLSDLKAELQALYDKMGEITDELPKALEEHNAILIADGDLQRMEITDVRKLQVRIMDRLRKSEERLYVVLDYVGELIDMGGDQMAEGDAQE